MCKKESDSNRMLLFLFAISLFAFAGSANAFPTWIGVYGDYQHHNGVNPGIYTVLMNQDYYGLHAEVGIQVNSNGYGTYAMSYIGSDSGNSVWQFEVPVAYASNDYVQFYFHGWDDWGGNIYDNNSGWNYSYYAGAAELDWVGNTTQYPTNGAFYAGEDLWVNSESWPRSSGKSGFVLYAQGTNWQGISLSYAGTSGENDWWHQQIGRFSASSTVSYVVGIKDEAGITSYDNNNGSNYSTVVRAGNPMQWAGDVYHWPTNGALTCTNDLWLNLEAWPSNTLVRGYALYSINGFMWWSEPLSFDQIIDNNEAWHVNLGLIPPAVDVRYLFELEDGKGTWHLLPSNDVPFSATVNTTGTDSDSDGLPDDWEQFWFGDLSASPHDNDDNDGVSGLPLDDRLEYLFGTDPAVSNASETLRLLWFPSDPFKGGWIRLSAYASTNEAIYDAALIAALRQDSTTWSTNLQPDGERFAVSLPLGTSGTALELLHLAGNGATNDNHTIGWSISLRDLASGEMADSDGDGLPDDWEVLNRLNPLDIVDAGYDTDGDSLNNLSEYLAGSDIYNSDTDGDGFSDAHEIEFNFNPAGGVNTTGVNRNWLYHNAVSEASPLWESVPGYCRRFVTVDTNNALNTAYFIASRNIAPATNDDVDVKLHIYYQVPGNPASNYWVNAECITQIVINSEGRFHDLPATGSILLDVYAASWERPAAAERVTNYYTFSMTTRVDDVATDGLFLLSSIEGMSVAEGYNTNNWPIRPQAYGPNFLTRDYKLINHDIRFRNGDFEMGTNITYTNMPYWNYYGESAFLSTNLSYTNSGHAFVSMEWSGLVYQPGVLVHPGEELVLSGRLFTPALTNAFDTNMLSGERYGLLSLEFYSDGDPDYAETAEIRFTCAYEPEVWHYVAVTSIVPRYASTANVTLRLDGFGYGHVYYDDIRLTINDDADLDGIPSAWETQYGLNPGNPMDGVADPDLDGLNNLEEYRQGCIPGNPDTDGDGMPDGWELQNSLDPLNALDAQADFDGDELSNLVEYQHTTDVWNADTDYDNEEDGLELNELETDPLTQLSGQMDRVLVVQGADIVTNAGSWFEDITDICSETSRGWVEYELTVSTADVYRLEIAFGQYDLYADPAEFRLRIYIDDTLVDRPEIQVASEYHPRYAWLTPYLNAGTHTLRIELENLNSISVLRIKEIILFAIAGADSDSNGQKDWVENRLRRMCGIDTNIVYSYVSPACFEGWSVYPELISCSGGNIVCPAPDHRWYIDAGLSATTETQVAMSFQNGGLVVTGELNWVPFNTLDESSYTVRQSNTLMMVAAPQDVSSGTCSIQIVSITNYSFSTDQPVTHLFDQTGDFTIVSSFTSNGVDVLNNTTMVQVVGGGFTEEPVCWLGRERIWTCTNLNQQLLVESDARINMEESTNYMGMGRQFIIEIDEPEERYVIARLSEGPILDSAILEGAEVFSSASCLYEVHELTNGITQVDMVVYWYDMPADAVIDLEIFVGSTFFDEELQQQHLTLTRSDFNELGEYTLRFYVAPENEINTCHRFRIYQNGELVGDRRK